MTPRARLGLAAGLVALTFGAACDATPDYLKEQARRDRLVALGVVRFDSAGAFQLAGMSTRRKVALVPLESGELPVADTLGLGYHTFHMRCASCHDVPSPATKPGYLWEATMSRMKKNAADAGLMPISEEDEAIVLDFLREHASDAR
jgi:hypothetical protein